MLGFADGGGSSTAASSAASSSSVGGMATSVARMRSGSPSSASISALAPSSKIKSMKAKSSGDSSAFGQLLGKKNLESYPTPLSTAQRPLDLDRPHLFQILGVCASLAHLPLNVLLICHQIKVEVFLGFDGLLRGDEESSKSVLNHGH